MDYTAWDDSSRSLMLGGSYYGIILKGKYGAVSTEWRPNLFRNRSETPRHVNHFLKLYTESWGQRDQSIVVVTFNDEVSSRNVDFTQDARWGSSCDWRRFVFIYHEAQMINFNQSVC